MLADLAFFCFGSWPKLSVLMLCCKIELLQIDGSHAFLDYFYLIWGFGLLQTMVNVKSLFWIRSYYKDVFNMAKRSRNHMFNL